ncbi:MAG: MarR family winged helix-turn-helix transcriptional regulator [Faecousia sp.]
MQRRRTIMKAVARTRRVWNNHMKEIARAVGIPDSYRTVIMFLSRKPGASQRTVAEFAEVTTSAINQTVKSMMEEGYLYKETDECDRRQSKLFLTEKGEEAANKLRERLSYSDEVITALITPEKEAEMMELLYKITECIQRDLSC